MRAAFILFLPAVAAVAPLQTLPGRRGAAAALRGGASEAGWKDPKEMMATARESYFNEGRLPGQIPFFVKIAVASASSVALRPFLDQHRAVLVRLRLAAWALVALYGILGLQHIPDLIASLLTSIIVTNPNFSPMTCVALSAAFASIIEIVRAFSSTYKK